ncbi:phd finger protein, putative, partial [Plasmodium ovale curtisi]
YFHVHCYKTFCDHFNLNKFLCDVCIETNYYVNKNRNNYLAILGDQKKYNFSYSTIYDSDSTEQDEAHNGYEDVYIANLFEKLNNLKFKNNEDKQVQINKYKELYTKHLSDNELCDSNKYMTKLKETHFFKKVSKKKDESPSICSKSNKNENNNEEIKNCDEHGNDSCSDAYQSDAQHDRNIFNLFGIYYNSFSANHSSISRNNKDVIKRLKESQKMISNMFPEKLVKHNKNNKSNYIHYIQYKMRRKMRKEIRKEIKELNKCRTDNATEISAEDSTEYNNKVNISCDICNKSNNNVIMKKGENNKWFHLCCLYYNNITKNNSIVEIYFEYFFFNYYNEDYFVNLYGSLKSVNEIIIKKIKEQLLSKYNILIHSHSFNFLLNPYYYNLTLKQIKSIIYYNFILKNNFIYQTGVNNNTIPYLRMKHEQNVPSNKYNTVLHLKNLSPQSICNLKNEKQFKEYDNCRFITTDQSCTGSVNETCSYSSGDEDSDDYQQSQTSYIINNKNLEIKNLEAEDSYEEMYEEELTDKNESKKDTESMYCIDTNNCTIINDGTYFCEDVSNIINNYARNEINDNIIKQSEYNNMFKDIEKLIYRRDFLNLNIIKIIKEKIIESIKINNSKICIFCKKNEGIKTK